ncbi:MAG TPA: acyltransferase family protein, partial [Polyangiales bacterium]
GSELVDMSVSNRNLLATLLAVSLVVGTYTAPGSLVARGFALPWMTYLGKISYGIYIFHFPAQAAIERLARGVPTLGQLLLQVAVTVAISAASYELFEVRFLVLKERWFPSRDATPMPATNDSTSLPKPTGAP